MNDLRTAAQQALEFVTSKQWGTTPYMDVRVYEDAARLRDELIAALEQQEQEPVARMHEDGSGRVINQRSYAEARRDGGASWSSVKNYTIPLYTTPPRREWRGLTDEEMVAIAHRKCWEYRHSSDPHHSRTYKFNHSTLTDFRYAVEAALKEKNHE